MLPAPYYARLQKRPELGIIQHRFVEIRDAERGHKLITLVEIVSPSNKYPGPDRRAYDWMDYTLYPIQLRDPLPCIPVPLSGDDPDILLDLQIAVNRVYREGPYVRAIDYSDEPRQRLDEADIAWVDERLRLAGLRR